MRTNHVPRAERLKARIMALQVRLEQSRRAPRGGNPYWSCKECGIYDPQLYVPGGRHHKGCSMQGVEKQIKHYRLLLEPRTPSVEPPNPPEFPGAPVYCDWCWERKFRCKCSALTRP
jgi:hypothetical protein